MMQVLTTPKLHPDAVILTFRKQPLVNKNISISKYQCFNEFLTFKLLWATFKLYHIKQNTFHSHLFGSSQTLVITFTCVRTELLNKQNTLRYLTFSDLVMLSHNNAYTHRKWVMCHETIKGNVAQILDHKFSRYKTQLKKKKISKEREKDTMCA